MMTIQEIAAAKAGRASQPADTGEALPPQPELLPDHGIPEPAEGGPEQVAVHVAWSRVMSTVGVLGKRQYNDAPGAGYSFRGVDAALNAFGPACRLHGVLVLPVRTEAAYRDVKTSTGKASRECTVTVTYKIIGPRGDDIEVQSVGECMDNADKGTAKALSTALRSLLFLGGLVPTGDADPDSSHIERGSAPVRSANDFRDDLLRKNTSYLRTQQIGKEVSNAGMLNEMVVNEVGEMESLNNLGMRLLAERSGGAS